jgi:hypothetical protein
MIESRQSQDASPAAAQGASSTRAPREKESRRRRAWRIIKGNKFSRRLMLQARIDGILEGEALDPDRARRAVAVKHAQRAAEALDNNELERAWRNVLIGERLVYEGNTNEQLGARAAALAAETNAMLPPADAKPITELLSRVEAENSRPREWREIVIEAQTLYDRRTIFLYDTRERTAFRIAILVSLLFVLIVSFMLLMWRSPNLTYMLYGSGTVRDMDTPMLFATFLLGSLGACLSALLSYTSLGQAPGIYESAWVTAARPLVGAVSGVVAVMLVRASLVDFKSPAAVGLVAFIFGFSERLIIGAVQRFEAAQKS